MYFPCYETLYKSHILHEQHAEGRNVGERKLSFVCLTVLLTLDSKEAFNCRAETSCKIGLQAQQNKTTDHGKL